jgi:hypothetical protein
MRWRSWLGASLAALLVAAAALAPRPASAVEQTGDLTGTVRDEKSEVLPGATITLKGENLLGERSTVTDTKGEFSFRALPPGKYTVKIGFVGYQGIEQDGVVVNIGRTTTLPVNLTKGELTESVTVVGRTPLVDTVRTTTQDNYGPEYLQEVQIGSNGRSYQSVIANSAGTAPGDGANPTVRGSTLGGNVYLVDGVDSTDPVTATFGTNFVYNAIQEIQFQTGGFNAEFGRATGGIANIVTKSGGNDFSGSFDGRFRNENFYETGDHFDSEEFDINREIYEATFGGPILKDKVWFFLAGGLTKADFAGDGYNAVNQFHGYNYLGKLTWQASANHKFIAQVTGDPATIDNSNAGPLTAAEASSKQTQGSTFYTAQYEGILGPSLILNIQAAHYTSNLDVEPQSGDLDTIGYTNFVTGEATRNYNDAQFSDRFRDQFDATVTWNLNDRLGDHTFKFGTDLQKLKFDFNQFTPGGETDEICTTAEGCPANPTFVVYNVVHPAGELENKGHVEAFFAQDEWRVLPRLTFNLGLRYEAYAYDDDRGQEVFDASLLQPRAGIAWDITGDARNVWKVFGGRFGDASMLAVPSVVNSRASATDTYLNEIILGQDFNGDGTIEDHAFFGTFGGPGGSIFAHDGHLNATSVVEYQTSYERRINAASAVGITIVRRKTYNIIEDRLNEATGIYEIDNLAQADRNYYGAELRYSTQWKKLFLAASYNWSKSRGNVEYTQSLGTDFDLPVLSENRYGYLSDDVRHAVKLNGYYDLPLQFQFGFAYNYNSGAPWTTVRSAIPYGQKFLEPRGSQRFPDIHQLDLDFRKGFNIGPTTLKAVLSVINVFDTEIVTAVNNNLGQNGQAIGWQTPRRYEIGAAYQF